MATTSKRSAGEAFEDVEPADPTNDKKRRKRKRAGKSKGEGNGGVNAEAAQPSPSQAHTAQDQEQQPASATLGQEAHAASDAAEPHGGKSKKKRRLEWKKKQEQAAASSNGVVSTVPEQDVQDVEETAEAEPGPVSSPTAKTKTRRAKKKKKSGAVDGSTLQAEAEDEHSQEAAAAETQQQQERTAGTTMGSHAVESAQEAKRRRKQEKKLLKVQLQQAAEGVPSASPDDGLADEDAASKKPSKKRKRRRHASTPQPQLANGDSSKTEQSDHVTAVVDAAASNGSEVKTLPLEDRITVPDHHESRQHLPKVNGNALSADEVKPRNKKHGHRVDKKSAKYPGKQWTISDGVGGVFIDQDPILTADDQHMIVATRAQVRVYSRASSLLVRKLELDPDDGPIVSCSLLKGDDALLVVATSRGVVSIWDWTDGTSLDACLAGNGLKKIVPFLHDGRTSAVAVHATDDKDSVKFFNLATGSQDAEEVAKVHDGRDIEHMQFFAGAGVILISARSRIEIGVCRKFSVAGLDGGSSFKWHRLGLPANVASFDARVGTPVGKRALAQLDLVVGLANGDIHSYTDVLTKLVAHEHGRLAEIEPQKLSWHRNSVNTVKWSRDLTHIISGGRETTLVIWQVDTRRQQYLPHLSAPILNLSVSDRGSAYALRLADNSVMTLDTANLTPESNVSGLAAPVTGPLVATLDPNAAEKVLLACPAAALQPLRQEDQNTSLQTYDAQTDVQLGRQALTRNLTTVVNVDPEGRPLREPNVSRLQISADGRWLATIDEWRPLNHDLDATHIAGETRARKHESEIRLRIWAYNAEQGGGDWELVTRVDQPNSVARILSVQAHPTRAEFAAVGADGVVRVWQPKARVRDGVRVRDAQGRQLFTWANTYAVNVPVQGHDEAKSAALTYSDDGSLLAVSLELDRRGAQWTHLLDAATGTIVQSIPDLVTAGERCVAVSGHYLLLLSQAFTIYDFVAGQVVSRTELDSHFQRADSSRFLAVNRLDHSAAFALSRGKRHSSHLTVIDVSQLDKGPVLEAKIPGQLRALLAHTATTGFVLIDGFNEVRTLKPPSASSRALGPVNATRAGEERGGHVAQGLDRLFGRKTAAAAAAVNGDSGSRPPLDENDAPQVAGRGLEGVVSFLTSAQAPNVTGLFERVAQAVS